MQAVADAYPRPGGVLVPQLLIRAGCPAPGAPSSPAGRAQVVGRAIDWLRTRLDHLPADVQEAKLPDPHVMLRTWRLGARTRGALARLPAEPGRRWRLRDLVGHERFGAAALIDVLAAREEQAAPPAPAAHPQPGGAVRAIRREGITIPVAASAVNAADALLMSAAHLVFRHGLSTIEEVVSRARSGSAPEAGEDLARWLLPLLPSFRWLDEPSGWFSLAQGRGHVSSAARKIFAVARRASTEEVRQAIAKRAPALRKAPGLAVQRYLTEVIGCQIVNDWVLAGPGLTPTRLTKGDRAILSLLPPAGEAIAVDDLRAAAKAAGISPAALRRFLQTSPTVIAGGETVRIIGSPELGVATTGGRGPRAAQAPLPSSNPS